MTQFSVLRTSGNDALFVVCAQLIFARSPRNFRSFILAIFDYKIFAEAPGAGLSGAGARLQRAGAGLLPVKRRVGLGQAGRARAGRVRAG